MKRIFLIILAVSLLFVSTNAQKKKDLQRYNIKAITVYNEDHEDGKGKAVIELYTLYDELGNVVEEIEYNTAGKQILRTTYEYNEDNKKSKEVSWNTKGEKGKTIEYVYNEDGEKTKEITLNSKGEKDKIVEYKYKDDFKTERLNYYPNGKLKTRKTYKYDFH